MTDDESRQFAYQALADEAKRLQTQINEFIGRATVAHVDLPAAIYKANAELLLLPARLHQAVTHRSEHAAARRDGASRQGGERWRLGPLSR